MERTDWLEEGFGAADARFQVVTGITHHRFGSRLWSEAEIRKLQAELAEIDAAGEALLTEHPPKRGPVSVATKLSRSFLMKGGSVSS